MRRFMPVALLLFGTFAAAAAIHDSGVDGRGVLKVIAQAPSEARTRRNPYSDDPRAIAAGQKLFRQHCAECHGVDARGRNGAPDLRSSAIQNATAGELTWFLRNGNLAHGMPSWSGLPEQRRWQIVSYIKSLERAGP